MQTERKGMFMIEKLETQKEETEQNPPRDSAGSDKPC